MRTALHGDGVAIARGRHCAGTAFRKRQWGRHCAGTPMRMVSTMPGLDREYGIVRSRPNLFNEIRTFLVHRTLIGPVATNKFDI